MRLQEHSKKVRALIVDDEELARCNLAVLLRRDPEIEIAGECASGSDAIAEIRRSRPDLVFLDVQMPECDGFDVLEMLGKDLPAALIFVTAYDQYALRAFEVGALDYILKPFDNARFERAVERAKERIRSGENPRGSTQRLAVKAGGRVLFLKFSEIDWIEAADYYACLHVGARTHLLRRSMAELERELDQDLFCRVHRSAIVNLDRIRGLKMNEDGEYDILLGDGTSIRLSRSCRKELHARLGVRHSKSS